jgi:nucleoside-diphosphate-sugar epimerase
MKVLITGNSGFIGRAVVRLLVAQGAVVAGLDKRPFKGTERLAYHFECDLLDKSAIAASLEQFAADCVIHLAARIDLDETRDIRGYASNIDGTRNLVDAVRQTPSVRRVIWTSSQLVCKVGYVPKRDDEYNPDTLYGQSKVMTEQIVRSQDGADREWCIVRPTTVWGPGMSAHYRRFLRAIEGGYYFHVGYAPLRKSYSYISNIAYQYGRLLEASYSQIHGKTFYLADYEPIDLIAWSDAFQHGLGARPIRHIPRTLAIALARGGDLANVLGVKRFPFNSFRLRNILTQYQFDLEPTRVVCGPLPIDMITGVEETIDWYQSKE